MTEIVPIGESRVYLLGDVHGCWWRVERLLRQVGWDDGAGNPAPPPGAVLIQVGDLIDRGKRMARRSRAAHHATAALPDRVARLTGGALETLWVPPPEAVAGPPVRLMDVAAGRLSWPHAMRRHQQKLLSHACDSLETVRFFMKLQVAARRARARVVCLLGNHEADLLRGRFRHARRKKTYLLALLKTPLDAILAHERTGLTPAELHALHLPELDWLFQLPILAVGQGVAVVHGGPAERLIIAMDTMGLHDLDALSTVFREARSVGFDHPMTEEGASLLSPSRPEDDMFMRPLLLHRFLHLAGADILAVGHSPFLHFPRGRWVDIDDPEVRELLEAPAFLGCHGEVLKLDTDVKRGGPAWLVCRDIDAGRWHAVREDGYRLTLAGPHSRPVEPEPVDVLSPAASRGVPLSWPVEGVDSDALQQVHGALEALRDQEDPAIVEGVQQRLAALLHAGMADLAPLVHGLRWRGQRLRDWYQWFDAWSRKVAARHGALCADLEALLDRAGGRLVRFVEPPEICCVGGYWVQFLPCVAAEVAGRRRSGRTPGPIVTVSYVSRLGGPHVGVHRVGPAGQQMWTTYVPVSSMALTLTSVRRIVDRALLEERGGVQTVHRGVVRGRKPGAPGGTRRARAKFQAGSPVEDPMVTRCLLAWAAAAGASPGADGCRVVQDALGREVPGRFLVDLGAEGTVPVLRLPDGAWVPANSAFVAPHRRFPVVIAGRRGPERAGEDHATWLLRYLDSAEVALYSAVSPELAAILGRGDVDLIGRSDARRPAWQRGRYLFLSPSPDIGRYFFNKAMTLRFAVPRAELVSAVAAGLSSINLFISDRGEVLQPDARFGAPDVGIEVVAVGGDGIEWVLDYLR